MRRNLYIKSMLRQPLYSALLMLLIAISSFGFVARAVEYTIILERIETISGFFSNVGVLAHSDGITADASEAIAYLSNYPAIAFYDIRRGFEGTLVDMHNAYVDGSFYWRAAWAYRNEPDEFDSFEYIELLPRLRPFENFAGFTSGDSFFYGTLIDVRLTYERTWGMHPRGFYPHKLLYIQVDDVLQGYPSRLFEGQILRLRMDFPHIQYFLDTWDFSEEWDEREVWNSPLENMEIGQRYFFKGTFYFMLGNLQLHSQYITKMIKPIGDGCEDSPTVWYIPLEAGEEVDPDYIGITEQLRFARHVQSAVYLRTTRDMYALPYSQVFMDMYTLVNGRFINYEDYLEARQVVVVQRRFAERLGVRVGDTITVNVNACQHLVYSPYYIVGNPDDGIPISMNAIPTPMRIMAYSELGILSTPGAYPYVTLELEVVGVFDLFRFRTIIHCWSSINKFMFIPDSILPADWGLQSAYFGDISENYTPALWYSFVLSNPRSQLDFTWDTRDRLGEMGFRVDFIGRDGTAFWAASDTILMSTAINLLTFSVAAALILMLSAFMYLRKYSKEFVIQRALGQPGIKLIMQSMVTVMLFGLPAVLSGAIGGWFYARYLIEDALEGFGEIVAFSIGRYFLPSERAAIMEYYTEAVMPGVDYLVVLCGVIFVMLLVSVFVGNLFLVRKPILHMLQRGGR